jgi:hypothetical protein
MRCGLASSLPQAAQPGSHPVWGVGGAVGGGDDDSSGRQPPEMVACGGGVASEGLAGQLLDSRVALQQATEVCAMLRAEKLQLQSENARLRQQVRSST